MSPTEKDWANVQETEQISSDNEVDATSLPSSDVSEDGQEPVDGILGHPSYLALADNLTKTEQMLHEAKQETLLARADIANARRRADDSVAKAHLYGLVNMVEALLPVADSLEQAEASCKDIPSELAVFADGVTLTHKLLQATLAKFNVTCIDPMGEVFDPNRHEAMALQDIPGAAPNTVVNVLQKGYALNDRVIRPARVMVSKPSS